MDLIKPSQAIGGRPGGAMIGGRRRNASLFFSPRLVRLFHKCPPPPTHTLKKNLSPILQMVHQFESIMFSTPGLNKAGFCFLLVIQTGVVENEVRSHHRGSTHMHARLGVRRGGAAAKGKGEGG